MVAILQVIIALATIATGILALLFPRSIRGFTGLAVDSPRGVTEIRAVMGGVFIALGLVPLVFNAKDAYWMLGITYLTIAVIRTLSMVIDKSVVRSNVISLLVEILFALILIFDRLPISL